MALQFRRGTAAERLESTDVPLSGEPWFTYDDGNLYVGDGVTPGGINVASGGGVEDLENVTLVSEKIASIASYSIASNVAEIATIINHNYYEGLEIVISNSSVSALNGTFTIQSIIGGNIFSINLTAANVDNTTATGTITPKIPDGSSLLWDEAQGIWVNGIPQVSVGDLTDVELTSAPVNNDILQYNSTSGNFVNVQPVLGKIVDVDSSYSTNFSYLSNNIGKTLKYDYDGKWRAYPVGETLKDFNTTDYFGIDWSTAITDAPYTPNAAKFTRGTHFAVLYNGSPSPAWGKAIYNDDIDYVLAQPISSTGTSFTLDFLYNKANSGRFPIQLVVNQTVTGGAIVERFALQVRIDNTFVRLYSQSPQTGETFSSTSFEVRYWNTTIPSGWNHYRIVRSGLSYRLYLNGSNIGSGLSGSGVSVLSTWNLRLDKVNAIRVGAAPVAGQTSNDVTGAVYIDFRQALSSPTSSANITAPTSRFGESLYAKSSGIILQNLDNVKITNPAVNDGLQWDGTTWVNGPISVPSQVPSQIKATSFGFTNLTEPTSVVADSDSIGRGLGSWLELTSANSSTSYSAPELAAFNPSLTGVLFNSSNGYFYNFEKGKYLITCSILLRINNPTPSYIPTSGEKFLYTSLYVPGSGPTYKSYSAYQLSSVLPYASYGSVPSWIALSFTLVCNMEYTNAALNQLYIFCDQDQGPTLYAQESSLNILKIADIT